MPQVNPNDVAATGVQALQGAIARLDALKQQPQADLVQIDAQIGALQIRQTTLRDQALRTIEQSAVDSQTIAALTAAAACLAAEAATMQATERDLTGVAKVVTAATSLAVALARFA